MIPEQYKTGVAHFMDFEFKVSEDTFIPRPETELLVEKVIETAKSMPRPHILDIGTGCGNIAISLTKYLPQSKITALDVSHKALVKTRENIDFLGLEEKIFLVESDLLSSIKRIQLFDIIVSNPPYISEKDMNQLSTEVKEEPSKALYGGVDGLDFYRRIIRDAKSYLKKDGALLLEMGYDQSGIIRDLLETTGYINIEIFKDYNRIDRIARARWIS